MFIWRGPDVSNISWALPDGAEAVSSVQVVFNDAVMATFDRTITEFALEHSADGDAGTLRIQSLDAGGSVIAEVVRQIGTLGAEYDEAVCQFSLVEETAEGRQLDAIQYTLSAEVYRPGQAELF